MGVEYVPMEDLQIEERCAAAMKRLGPKLRETRKRRDVPLHVVAAQTGLNVAILSRVERGLSSRAMPISTFIPVILWMGTSADEYLGLMPAMPKVGHRCIITIDDAPPGPEGQPRVSLYPAGTGIQVFPKHDPRYPETTAMVQARALVDFLKRKPLDERE